MKKIYILVIAFLLVGTFAAQAQLKLGLKGGLNLPSMAEQGNTISLDSKTGWHGGAMVEIKLPILGIQGDFLYSANSFENPTLGQFKSANFTIPIVAKLYLFKILTIQAGPQFSFVMSADSDLIADVKDQLETSTFGFVAGLGVNLGPLDVHGRFIFPTTTKFTAVAQEYKTSVIQLSVGVWLKK